MKVTHRYVVQYGNPIRDIWLDDKSFRFRSNAIRYSDKLRDWSSNEWRVIDTKEK